MKVSSFEGRSTCNHNRGGGLLALVAAALLAPAGCAEDPQPLAAEGGADEGGADEDGADDRKGKIPCYTPLSAEVRGLIQARGITPLAAPPPIRAELVDLGRALFHDKILSGGRDVSCGTCHNPALGLTDRRPLNAGIKGHGVGLDREDGQVGGRHTQTLFNLHTLETLTIDGKVEEIDGNVFGLGLPVILPKYQDPFEDFPGVVAPHVIAGQAMLPEVTFGEMLGVPGTDPNNELFACLDPQLPLPVVFGCVFDGYMARLGAIPEYVDLFEAAYPGVAFADMNFGHAGNAIAAYELSVFAATQSPWDEFVAGDNCALSHNELHGAKLFLDPKGPNCVSCHAGAALTDNDFHQTLAPTLGCGNDLPKRNGPTGYDDFGRTRNDHAIPWVLGGAGDEVFPVDERYSWRTPPLRNVEFTAPYGRIGQYATLEGFIEHYIDPEDALLDYDITQLPDTPFVDYTGFCAHDSLHDSLLANQSAILASGSDPLLDKVKLHKKKDVARLAAFLRALSDPASDPAVLAAELPASVPSGLPVDAP